MSYGWKPKWVRNGGYIAPGNRPSMGNRDIATYIAFGFSFITAIIPFIGSGHLWKPKFFKKCLIAATVSGFAGIVLELTSALGQKIGMTIVVMFTPLIYLAYFQ